jgi:hypothetical protein
MVAWTRGRLGDAIAGYAKLLAAEGGHLVAALAMAAVAGGFLAAVAYAIVLLLPPQPWVLNAADSYAHFLTLPVGLWTLAALIELGQRALPSATLVRPAGRAGESTAESGRQHSASLDARPEVAAPAS